MVGHHLVTDHGLLGVYSFAICIVLFDNSLTFILYIVIILIRCYCTLHPFPSSTIFPTHRQPSLETALASCKSSDDCDHGARCIPCKMSKAAECDLDGVASTCTYSSMCDATVDTSTKTRKWQLRRNVIETDHPTLSVEDQNAVSANAD